MRTVKILSACILVTTVLAASGTASASDWGIVVNGKAFHVGAAHDWNEANWGLGFEREFDSQARWVKLTLGSGFVDSQNAMSYMGGGGLKRRFRFPRVGAGFYVDIGAVGFLMTRRDIDNNRPFPGILPTITLGSRHFAVNLAYLPGSLAHEVSGVRSLDPDIDAIYFLQVRLSPRLFAPATSRRLRNGTVRTADH